MCIYKVSIKFIPLTFFDVSPLSYFLSTPRHHHSFHNHHYCDPLTSSYRDSLGSLSTMNIYYHLTDKTPYNISPYISSRHIKKHTGPTQTITTELSRILTNQVNAGQLQFIWTKNTFELTYSDCAASNTVRLSPQPKVQKLLLLLFFNICIFIY